MLLTGKAQAADASSQKRGIFQQRELAPQGFSQMALDNIQALVSNVTGTVGDEADQVPPEDATEAAQAVSAFCESYPAVRVKPTTAELNELWLQCADLHPLAVAEAICDQLSWGNGASEWQQKMRALYVLDHFAGQGEDGAEVVLEACASAEDILLHLVREVPQCRELASSLLATHSPHPLDPPGSCEKLFLVYNAELAARTNGLGYRVNKFKKHKDTRVPGPRWGTTIRGVDQGDGWVRVGDRYLPVKLHGQPVLHEQEEPLPEAEAEARVSSTSTPSSSAPSSAALPDIGPMPTFWQAAFPTEVPCEGVMPQTDYVRFDDEAAPDMPPDCDGMARELEGVFDEEVPLPPFQPQKPTPEAAPLPESSQAETKMRYLWLSAVEMVAPKQPDPFAFASEHAFSSTIPAL